MILTIIDTQCMGPLILQSLENANSLFYSLLINWNFYEDKLCPSVFIILRYNWHRKGKINALFKSSAFFLFVLNSFQNNNLAPWHLLKVIDESYQ